MRRPPSVSHHLLLAILTLCLIPGAEAASRPSGDDIEFHAAAMALVHRLGDDAFCVRKRATEKLIEMGMPAMRALGQGRKSRNREVRYRSEQIIEIVRRLDFQRRLEAFLSSRDDQKDFGLPGWDGFRRSVGSGAEARALFVRMQKAEPEAMQSVAGGPAAISASVNRRSEQLQQWTRLYQKQLSLGSIAAMFFLATRQEVTLTPGATSALYGFCSQGRFRRAMQSGAEEPLMRKLVGAWVRRGSGPTAQRGLLLSVQYNLPDGVALAEKILKNPDNPASTRQYAILTIAKMGSEKQIPLLETLLADNTRTNGRSTSRVRFETQIRDVALAALVQLTGQDHKQYGFARLQKHPLLVFNTRSLGFMDDAQREEAIQKWREYRQRQQARDRSD